MDETTSERVIAAGLLGAVGALWRGAPTVISPLRHEAAETVDEAAMAALTSAGVCGPDGAIEAGFLPAVEILGSANAFTRVYLSGGEAVHEMLVYWEPSGETASMVNVAGSMQVDTPALAELFVGVVAQSLGASFLRNSPFEATLSSPEAVVLAAMIDLQRRALMLSLAEGRPEGSAVIEIAAIERACSMSTGDNQWLKDAVLDMLSSHGLDAQGVRTALQGLAAKGLAAADGSAMRLDETVQYLARRMLVLDNALVLTSGHVSSDGIVNVAGFTCLQSGVHDLLYIEAAEEGVEFKSVSSAEILEIAEAFLTDPAVVSRLDAPPARLAPPEPQAAQAPTRSFCTSCGSRLLPGAAFCTACGAKVG